MSSVKKSPTEIKWMTINIPMPETAAMVRAQKRQRPVTDTQLQNYWRFVAEEIDAFNETARP